MGVGKCVERSEDGNRYRIWRKKREEKRRGKVINNVNKYNWSKGGSGDEDEWVGPAGRKTRK